MEAESGECVEEVRVRDWTGERGERGEPRMAWRLVSIWMSESRVAPWTQLGTSEEGEIS